MILKFLKKNNQILSFNFLIKNNYRFANNVSETHYRFLQKIDKVNSFQQFDNFYKLNMNNLTPALFQQFSRKLGNFFKDQKLKIPQRSLLFNSILGQFAKDLQKQNYKNYSLKQLQGVLYFLRIVNSLSIFPKQFFDLSRFIIQIVGSKIQKEQFQVQMVFYIFYATTILNHYSTKVSNKLYQIFRSNEPKYIQLRNQIKPGILYYSIASVKQKLSPNKIEKQILYSSCHLLYQKMSIDNINELVHPFCKLNQIISQRFLSSKQSQMLDKIKIFLIENIQKLNIKSIRLFLTIKFETKNNMLKQIYENIINNIFQLIDVNDSSQIEAKVILEYLKYYSQKQKNTYYLKPQHVNKLKYLIEYIIKNKKQPNIQTLNKQLPHIISNSLLKNQDLQIIKDLLNKYPQFNWSQNILCALSLKKINLSQYFSKCPKIKVNMYNTYKFINLATCVCIQLQLDQNNHNLKQLKSQLEQVLKQFTDIKGIEHIFNQKICKKFHTNFYKFFEKNIQKYPSTFQNHRVILSYFIKSCNLTELLEYIEQIQDKYLCRMLLDIIKRKIDNSDMSGLTNVLLLLDTYFIQILKFQKITQIKPFLKFLTYPGFISQVKPKNQVIYSNLFSIFTNMFSNIKLMNFALQKQLGNVLKYYSQSKRCQQIRKSLLYYELIENLSKNFQSLQDKFLRYTIYMQCMQLGIDIKLALLRRQQQQYKLFNIFQDYIVNKQIIEQKKTQLLQFLGYKGLNYTHKLIKQLNQIPKNIIKVIQQRIKNTNYSIQIKPISLLKVLKNKKNLPKKQLQDLYQSLKIYIQNNVEKFFILDISFFCNFFINQGIYPQILLNYLQNIVNTLYLPKFIAQKVITTIIFNKNAVRLQAKSPKKIQLLLRSNDLIQAILIEPKIFQNIEQKLRSQIQKSKQQKLQLNHILIKYIQILYPNLATITNQIKLAPPKTIQINNQQKNFFNCLTKFNFIKFQRKKHQEIIFYSLNNLNFVFYKGQLFQKKRFQLICQALRKILEKDVILLLSNTSVTKIGDKILSQIILTQNYKKQLGKFIQGLSTPQHRIAHSQFEQLK